MTNNDDLALMSRIEKAIDDFTKGRACMHVPAQSTDVDMVLSDCLALLAERDADKAENAQLRQRIAELEARTVSVKLPPVSFFDFKAGSGFADGAYVNLEAMNKELRKAGINLEVVE